MRNAKTVVSALIFALMITFSGISFADDAPVPPQATEAKFAALEAAVARLEMENTKLKDSKKQITANLADIYNQLGNIYISQNQSKTRIAALEAENKHLKKKSEEALEKTGLLYKTIIRYHSH